MLDFVPLFDRWKKEGDISLLPLCDWDVFQKVTLSETRTLSWPNLPILFTYKRETRSAPLELDALELYSQSQLVKEVATLNIGSMLREARMEAGLSQADVALKSGTKRNYISRIENNKSGIQFETLQKIVELGIGGEIIFRIKTKSTTTYANRALTRGPNKKAKGLA